MAEYMKRNFIVGTALFMAVAFTNTSCIDLIELNEDPNNPITMNGQPQLLFTGIAYNAFNQSEKSPAFAVKQVVQTDGESAEQVFKWSRGDFDMYDYMTNISKLQEIAADDSPYEALTKFFRANYFFHLTMRFGDIPYSQSLKGETDKIYTPSYDTQEQVLEGILMELAEASEILSQSEGKILGDIIYNGDLLKWRKLVNSYRLRILMALSDKEYVGNINIKKTFADIVDEGILMESAEDDGQLKYIDQEGNRYPFFNDSDFGSGLYMDETYVKLLAERKDPRLFAIATRTPNSLKAGKTVDDFTAYDGGDPSVPYSEVNDKATRGDCSKPADRYYKTPTNEPMILLGYSEQQLTIAEAIVRGWLTGNAQIYYNSAVKASFDFYSRYAPQVGSYLTVDDAEEYLNRDNVALKPDLKVEEKIERIIIQKYIPSFLQGRLWLTYIEALRTGYPTLKRAEGVLLPNRWMYPQSEYNNNPENVKAAIDAQFDGNDNIYSVTWWRK